MPRSYETVLIFESTLEDPIIEEKLARFKNALVPDAADTVDVRAWGKRKLAYPIKKKEQGIYMVLRYDTEPDRLAEFERLAKLDEQVLRQLTIVDPIEIPVVVAATSGASTDDDRDEEV